MGLVGLAVEAECIDRPFAFLHIGLFFRNLLRIQCHKLVNASDAEVVTELLVDLATVRLVDSDVLDSLLIETRLLLECGQQV